MAENRAPQLYPLVAMEVSEQKRGTLSKLVTIVWLPMKSNFQGKEQGTQDELLAIIYEDTCIPGWPKGENMGLKTRTPLFLTHLFDMPGLHPNQLPSRRGYCFFVSSW